MSLETIEEIIRQTARNRLQEKIEDAINPIMTVIQAHTYDITIKDTNGVDVVVSNLTALNGIGKGEFLRRTPGVETEAVNDFIRKIDECKK